MKVTLVISLLPSKASPTGRTLPDRTTVPDIIIPPCHVRTNFLGAPVFRRVGKTMCVGTNDIQKVFVKCSLNKLMLLGDHEVLLIIGFFYYLDGLFHTLQD